MSQEAKDIVRLTEEDRQTLQQLGAGPRVARAKALRARRRLKAAVDGPGWGDGQSADAFEGGVSPLHRFRQRVVEAGLEAALHRQPPPRTKPRTRDGAPEAHRVAIACSQAPAGRTSWTLRLLGAQLVALALVDSICPETVRKP